MAGTSLAQTTFVRDTFTAGSNQTLQAHTPDIGGAWSRVSGTTNLNVIAASDDLRTSSGRPVYWNAATPPGPEYMVGVTARFDNNSNNNIVELWARASATLNGYVAEIDVKGNVTLYIVAGGVRFALATGTASTVTANDPFDVLFAVENASKRIYIDGVLIASSTNNSITGAGLVGLSAQVNSGDNGILDDFFASGFSPTEARFVDARVTTDGRRASVEWTTAREIRNLGFRIHREGTRGRELATERLIAGSAFMVSGAELRSGSEYRWIDDDPGTTYWIEAISLDGTSDWYGPVTAERGVIAQEQKRAQTWIDRSESRGVGQERMLPLSVSLQATTGASRRRTTSPTIPRDAVQRTLAGSAAVKIGVSDRGWTRVSREALLAAGLDAGTDPKTLQLFVGGVEVPISVEGEERNSIDAIRFYGVPVDAAYSGEQVYWLTWGAATGKRIARTASSSGVAAGGASFPARVERRERSLYFAALLNGDDGNFFGPVISTDPSQATGQLLHTTHVLRGDGGSATLEVTIQGGTEVAHHVSVFLNGHAVGEVRFDGRARHTAAISVPLERVAEGKNTVGLVARGGDEDASVIEAVALTYPRAYVLDGAQLVFSANGGALTTFSGATGHVRFLDVSNPDSPVEIEALRNEAGLVEVVPPGNGLRTIIAASESALLSPSSVMANEPASLRDRAGELVIVTHPAFTAALQPLVEKRRAEGLSVVVASIVDIYDEFSFGVKDPAAVRSFLAHASRHWATKARWALLAGDASFDPRNYLGYGENDLVPTKLLAASTLETASDTWMGDSDGDGVAEVVIGRLPVRSEGEARAAVQKIIEYESSVSSPWMNRIILVNDADGELAFDDQRDRIQPAIPSSFAVGSVDVGVTGAAGGRQQILGEMEQGALLVDYVGHGSIGVWGNGSLLRREDAAALRNGSRLPFVVAVTCLNGYFHDATNESLGEAFFRNAEGGAIGVWASTALTSPELQSNAHRAFVEVVLSGARVGDAVAAAQRAAIEPDVRNTFLLIGDPSMRLRR